MVSAVFNEQAALNCLEQGWRRQGYTLLREPAPHQLPPFLQGVRPDAIAIGREPALLIEVLPRRSESGEIKLRRWRRLLDGRDDWRLEVVYATSEGAPLRVVDESQIRSALEDARRISTATPQAALIMTWAALEAIGRQLEPDLARRSLSTGSLIDLLISMGHVDEGAGAKLRALGETRNALVHGQIDLAVASSDISYLADFAEQLLT